jgi:DNA-binding beta-propeller fold protein YncE
MYKFGNSYTVVFTILSLSLILMGVTMLQSGYAQAPNTFSVSSIVLGNDKPISATIDEKANKVYGVFANENGAKNLLYIIDSTQNKVLETIKIGSEKNDFLSNIALDPERGILYAAGQHLVKENDTTVAYDTVYVINSTNNKFKRIQLYGETEEGKEGSLAGISVNPVTNKIYVGSLYPEGGKPGLYVIDGNTLESVHLEKWQYGIKDIQLDPESNFLYVGAKYDNLVSAIDGSNNRIVENITVQSPIALTINAKEKILYEAGSDGKVNAIDLSSKKNISSIQAEYVKNILFNPNDRLLYIVDQNMTNILSKNSNGTKSMAIAVNTTDNVINKFETNFLVENILINTSTDQAYLLGYDGKNSKLFIINSH